MPTGISNGNSHLNRSHREFIKYWQEEQLKQEKKSLREQLEREVGVAYRELIAIDPEGGEAWYDDDNNIPNVVFTFDGLRERIRLVRARVEELKAQKFTSCTDCHKAGKVLR